MSIYNVLLGASGPFLFFPTISTNQVDYNLNAAMVAAGWNGVSPVIASLTISTGVEFTSSANTIPAFTVGALPTGSSIYITNNGYIVGRGGAGVGKGNPNSSSFYLTAPASANGGVALSVSSAVYIDNTNGVVGGGGGGGGVGGNTSSDCSCTGCGGVNIVGIGVSGGGAGYGSAGSGYSAWKNNALFYAPATSSAGTLTAGGNSATANYSTGFVSPGGTGGTGGTLGVAGNNGTGGTTGRCSGYSNYYLPGTAGAAGDCTLGNSNITWVATGNRYGALN
jgi:hypothetical protein